MSWTKLDIVKQAFEMIGLASYVFDLQAGDLQSGLRHLDSMIASWERKGIRLGYPLPCSPGDSDIEDDSEIEGSAIEAVFTNLALRIAPSFGKVVMPELKQLASSSYKELLIKTAKPPYERQLPDTMPLGAGHKAWRDSGEEFVLPPVDPLLAGDDDIIEFD